MSAHVHPVAVPVVVTRRCACGGAVMRHNVTIEHLGWWARARREWQEDPGVSARADTSRRAITRAREEER